MKKAHWVVNLMMQGSESSFLAWETLGDLFGNLRFQQLKRSRVDWADIWRCQVSLGQFVFVGALVE